MTDDDSTTRRGSSRRALLAAAAAVGSVSVAGCLADDDDDDASPNGDDEGEDASNGDDTGNGDDDGNDEENGEESEGELHERYGYPSMSLDEEAPVEHDHVVELLMEPREEGPPEFYFEPAGLAVDTGDVVRFEFHSPDHAVAAFHEAFGRTPRTPEDAEPVSSPMMEVGTYWLCEFDEPGVWDLYCPPHEFLGMGMRLVVDEASGPATEEADPDVESELRPPEPELAATFNSDALDPDAILEDGSVPWEDVN